MCDKRERNNDMSDWRIWYVTEDGVRSKPLSIDAAGELVGGGDAQQIAGIDEQTLWHVYGPGEEPNQATIELAIDHQRQIDWRAAKEKRARGRGSAR